MIIHASAETKTLRKSASIGRPDGVNVEKTQNMGHQCYSPGERVLVRSGARHEEQRVTRRVLQTSVFCPGYIRWTIVFLYTSSLWVVLNFKDLKEVGWGRGDEKGGKGMVGYWNRETGDSFPLKINLLNLLNHFTARQSEKCVTRLISEREIWSNNALNVLRAVISWRDVFWCLSKAFTLEC